MIKSLHISEQQLPLAQRLVQICKKSGLTSEGKPEIDFLLLDREMEQLQLMQSRICQRIVEFVDQHLEEFIKINGKFENIGAQVQSTEIIIKKIIPKLDSYKEILLSPQSKLQQFVTSYEHSLVQQQLADSARDEAEFLLQFVRDFEQMMNVNMEKLSQKQKYSIVRILRKKQQIKALFEHPLLHKISNHTNDVSITLASVLEELEIYLSEQLTRIASIPQLRSLRNTKGMLILKEISIWYELLGTSNAYFEVIQDAIMGSKLSDLEILMTSHKQSLIIGNDEHIAKQFFTELFQLLEEFPKEYPTDRLLKILYKFLGRKQLNFMYSYVVPAFPISYSAYKMSLEKLQNMGLRNELEIRHGWNLKLWADLRIKTIMDRSGKDKEKPLSKWIEIVLKKNFMIYGVKHFMVKLCFLLVNRFCNKIEQEMNFTAKNLNDNYNSLISITNTLREKLYEGYCEELADEMKQGTVKTELEKIINSVNESLNSTIRKWLKVGMETIINSCKNSLEPYKSLIVGIIAKKEKKKQYNSQEGILKPLRGFLKNNPEIGESCISFVEECILEEIQKFYDKEYARDIYNHCNSNTSTDQMKLVMEIIATQRQTLFEKCPSKNQQYP